MKYILELKLRYKATITDEAIDEICEGVSHEKETTADGYRLMADNRDDMNIMYARTIGSLIIRSFLIKGVYTDESGVSDCTEELLSNPWVGC